MSSADSHPGSVLPRGSVQRVLADNQAYTLHVTSSFTFHSVSLYVYRVSTAAAPH
jgi:hypothetical protein